MPTEGPRQLLHEAAHGPVAQLDHDQLRRRARRRTRARRATAAALALVVVAGVGMVVSGLTGQQRIDIAETPTGSVDPDAPLSGLPVLPATLDLPPAGEVAAEHLGERPVFVIHGDDGEVMVVDAISPHRSNTEHPKVIAFCRQPWTFRTTDEQTIVNTPGTLADLWHGSRFTLDGAWLGGPAPTGLPRYEVLSAGDGTVEIGPPSAAPDREVGPFQEQLGNEIHGRPIADSTRDCTTEFDQIVSQEQPDDQTDVLWHQAQYPDRWAYPFRPATTRSGENEEVRACEPTSLQPTYLPWQEGPEASGDPDEVRSGTEDSPNASTTWAADPDAHLRDDADGDLSYVSVVVLHEYEAVGAEFPSVEVQGHRAELVWVGDPGIGPLSLRWRDTPGPCGARAVSLRIWGSPPYLDDLPDQEALDQAEDEEIDRLMTRYQEAVEQEIIKIAESLEEPEAE